MLVNFKELLAEARENKCAVCAFNCYNYETIRGAIEAAAELEKPIIIAFGENYFSNMDLEEVVALVTQINRKYCTRVVLHLDHCKSVANIRKAIQAGFTSVMYDGSELNLAENIKNTREVVQMAHLENVTVEAELGSLARGIHSNEDDTREIFTNPEEAKEFVEATGVDALAISIGTVHGLYKGKPKINIDVLKKINAQVNVPLVLHGGSGTPEDVLKRCIAEGIAKINVNTEISVRVIEAIRQLVTGENIGHFSELSLKSKYVVKENVKKYLRLFS